jgi:AraC-like DNA-binding protein
MLVSIEEALRLGYNPPVPHAVWAIGTKQPFAEGFEHAPHTHRQAELILTLRGLVTCKVENGLWMVPPQCALWIPAGVEHSARSHNDIVLYMVFVDPVVSSALPSKCCTVAVSPLLRELVVGVSRLPRNHDQEGADGRLVKTMLDQLICAPIEHLHVPLPADPRLRKIASHLAANPADRATVTQWARRVGASERTLSRLVPQETGMSFSRWRQQFHIMLALERLAEGESVQTVALDLGYGSSSAFVTMFRNALGQPPARYLASRRVNSSAAAESH